MMETTLGEILNDVAVFSPKNWVFIQDENSILPSSPCLVIDTEKADTGSDGFTPLQAENRGMSELLSIADLEDILEVLERSSPAPSTELKCAATAYYFKNDAFMPPERSSDS